MDRPHLDELAVRRQLEVSDLPVVVVDVEEAPVVARSEDDGDLDHVVIAQRGGILALDSKWRNVVTVADTAEMARAARRAKARAEGVTRTVLGIERGARHRAEGMSLTVTPVVVMWGAVQQTVPDGVVIEGVRFVAGRKLLMLIRELDSDAVSKVAALDALERLKEYRAAAWQNG